MNCHKWTPEEDRILTNLHEAGKSWAHIGRILDLGYEACRDRYKRHLSPPPAGRVKKRHLNPPDTLAEIESIRLKYNPKADEGLTYWYEDDQRADKRSPYDWRTGWLERRSQARGDYDWGLNPVMPGR